QLNFIRDNYSEQLSYYIDKNIRVYVELMTIDSFILDEALSILSWQVDDDLKVKLLEFVKTPLTVHGKNYPQAVNDYILENNFNPDEILILASSYKTWGTSTQSLILSRAIQDISALIASPNDISEPLLKNLFVAEGLNMQNKIALLIALLPGKNLSKATCKKYLDLLGLSEFSKILGRGKPKIEVDPTNQSLLTALRDNHFFSDFEVDDENPTYYKITRRRSMFGSDT
ncbi:hypothetical protein GAA20_21430, partial [Salmonella enterica]|nr:hypothetical protein [Salmonella enterica]EJI3070745.1 hypothetical protein [Salmonella enterica]